MTNTQRRTHAYVCYVWLSAHLFMAESHPQIMCRVLPTKGLSRLLVTWKLLIVWTISSPSSVLLQLVMGQVAQCHPLRVSERGNMGRPLGRLVFIGPMKDLWGSLGVLVQHYNDACHFEENPTVPQAHFPASVFGCNRSLSCVVVFAVFFSDLSPPAWVAIKKQSERLIC